MSKRQKETRTAGWNTQGVELRVSTDVNGKRKLEGYAAVYNSLSEDLGGFVEKIEPGAFDASLKAQPDVLALYHHDYKDVLGRTTSGTLQLSTDDRGLKFAIDLPNTTVANDLVELVNRGDIKGCSFGFLTDSDRWDDVQGNPLRTLLAVTLYEITVTPMPAYPDTSVALRSALRATGKDFACLCPCGQCRSGHCEICSEDACRWLGCRCNERSVTARSEETKTSEVTEEPTDSARSKARLLYIRARLMQHKIRSV